MRKLVDTKDIRQVFGKKTVMGYMLAPALMRLLKIPQINKLYDSIADYEGREAVEALLTQMGVSYDIPAQEFENIPKDGPFITVSNHAYGGLDGIMLMHLVTDERLDYKVVVNFLLSLIKPLSTFFLPVNAFDKSVSNHSSLTGIRLAKDCLAQGNGLGLFPAGEVSHISPAGHVEDIPWDTAIVKLIFNARVPVVPIYFDGHNSAAFLRKAKIHPLLQTASLPGELLNKKGKRISIRIGSAISVSDQERFGNYQELGRYLRARTYALAANIEKTDKLAGLKAAAPIALPRQNDLAIRELEQLPSQNCLFKINNYTAYFAPYSFIPNLMYEIGRRREEAFRTVGEGTFTPLDMDLYDRNYHHLILWDSDKKALVGAYRLGMGADLIKRFGIAGFYTSTLFDFDQELAPLLSQSIELGRAFICNEYRFETIPMMLLFKGLLHIMLRNTEYRYFVGPVSVSTWYPKLYQSLIYKFISEHFQATSYASMIHAHTPFTPDFGLVDAESLLTGIETPEQLDRLLARMSNRQYRLPSLVKRYLKINARVAVFNIDTHFNDSLDGFIIADIFDIPRAEMSAITKDISDPSVIEKRFTRP